MNAKPQISSIGQAAAQYADQYGWHVFPVPPGEKKGFKSAAHCDGRVWGATTDLTEISDDWLKWPSANVGIVCGPGSGLFVVECDTPEGHDIDGIASMAALIEQHGPLPATIEALSPSGSWHIYFRWPEGVEIKNSQSQVGPGIDVRGNGGMVVAVPSEKPGLAQPYRWKNPPGLFELADCPQWLLNLCVGRRHGIAAESLQIETGGYQGKTVDDYMRMLRGAETDGKKHEATRDLAASLAAQGCKRDFAEALIRTICPVDDANLRNNIESGFQKYAREGVDQPAKRESRFYSAASLKGKSVPEREWLVHDLVPQKTVTLFSGDGGTGKSLLALQLAVGAAIGSGWVGKAVNGGRVIFLSAEDDDDELHRRLDDILRSEGRGYDDVADLTLRSVAGEDALLAVEGQLSLLQSELFKELDALAGNENPALVVIDTLADVYPANENDRAKSRQFIGILRGLALKRRCAVLLLGHPSLTGLNSGTGTSGSTAWNNSVRSRLYLSRITDNGFEPDPDARVLTTMKANYGRIGGEINLKWQSGVFVAQEEPTGLDKLAAGAKGERVFLKLLDEYTAQGRYVSASPGPTYAPTQFASNPGAEGCTKRALKAAMDALFGRGDIQIATHGKGAKARSHLARKGANHDPE